jgi:hypothetical protein
MLTSVRKDLKNGHFLRVQGRVQRNNLKVLRAKWLGFPMIYKGFVGKAATTTALTCGKSEPIEAELFGANECRCRGIATRGNSPILAMCRALLGAGSDPNRAMHCLSRQGLGFDRDQHRCRREHDCAAFYRRLSILNFELE